MKHVGRLTIAGGVLVVSCLCGWQFYNYKIQNSYLQAVGNEKTYRSHYVMIADNNDSELWNSLYATASEEAKEQDAYLELMQVGSVGKGTLEDKLEIAIESDVDGIILRPNESQRSKKLIELATTQQIPVITVAQDDDKSTRTSFVGLNSYQIGEEYGNQILRMIAEDKTRVMVLMDDESDSTNDNIVFNQMKNTIISGIKGQHDVVVDAHYMKASNEFDSEEAIRDIFIEEQELPDILVCLNEADTECAYQALIDYNQVGNTQIVGFYQSDTIREAVKKGIIPVSVVFDTDQMAKYCVEALENYQQDGLTSEYFSVDLNLMTKENVDNWNKKTRGE